MKRVKYHKVFLAGIIMSAMLLCACGSKEGLEEENDVATDSSETSVTEDNELKNPQITYTTWDCIYFGSYWQSDTNGDGTADQKDEKEPIKWRVLSVDSEKILLLSDQILDCQPWDEAAQDSSHKVSWENSYMKSFLNETFLQNAFTEEEQSAISPVDKQCVNLLEMGDSENSDYGFPQNTAISNERCAQNTAYAEGQGAITSTDEDSKGNGTWWIMPYVYNYGNVDVDGSYDFKQHYEDNVSFGVRPVLCLNRSSVTTDMYAGTVTFDEEGNNIPTDSSGTSGAEDNELKKPRITYTTWDCIYFGSYWQSDTNGDGMADQKDEKEPIKWRVLSVDSEEILLLSDQILDCQPWDEVAQDGSHDVSWENSHLKSFLNETFLQNAFTEEEQSAISPDDEQRVKLFGSGGLRESAYGFNKSSRKEGCAKNTAYAEGQGAYTSTKEDVKGNGKWWLLPSGSDYSYVDFDGSYDHSSYNKDNVGLGVRPVLRLNRSFVTTDMYAGTAMADRVK